MNFLGRNIANIIENISIDRLSSYKYLDSDSTDLILSRYIFNVQISESFYPVIAALEISLRNRLYKKTTMEIPADNQLFAPKANKIFKRL